MVAVFSAGLEPVLAIHAIICPIVERGALAAAPSAFALEISQVRALQGDPFAAEPHHTRLDDGAARAPPALYPRCRSPSRCAAGSAPLAQRGRKTARGLRAVLADKAKPRPKVIACLVHPAPAFPAAGTLKGGKAQRNRAPGLLHKRLARVLQHLPGKELFWRLAPKSSTTRTVLKRRHQKRGPQGTPSFISHNAASLSVRSRSASGTLHTRSEIPRQRKRVEACCVIRIGRRILLYCEVEMSPVGRIDRRQIVVLFQRFDRCERAVNPCLAECVKQKDCAWFDTRNGRDFIAGPGRFGNDNPPGLRAISIAPPAHESESQAGQEAQQIPACGERDTAQNLSEQQAVLAPAPQSHKSKLGRQLSRSVTFNHVSCGSNLWANSVRHCQSSKPEIGRISGVWIWQTGRLKTGTAVGWDLH